MDWECGGNEKIKKSVYTQQKKYLEIQQMIFNYYAWNTHFFLHLGGGGGIILNSQQMLLYYYYHHHFNVSVISRSNEKKN